MFDTNDSQVKIIQKRDELLPEQIISEVQVITQDEIQQTQVSYINRFHVHRQILDDY